MSVDITIPPEAVEAVAMEMAPHPWSMYTNSAKDYFRRKARAACIAMLKSWPGMLDSWSVFEEERQIILPLTQEGEE